MITYTPETIIADYEELVKVKEFHMRKAWEPLNCTRQKILKDLEREFVGNIGDKIDRWVTVTNARYFKYAPGVLFYFQAKMLYRDGYYEAAISVSRSICEMICYDYLSKEPHPFGSAEEVEQSMLGPLFKFLAIQKRIPEEKFVNNIVGKISEQTERNFIKSCYTLQKGAYIFKTENGREPKNLKRIHTLFDSAGFKEKGIFKADTYNVFQSVYDLGSTYIHARTSGKPSKEDAITALNNIGKVLAYLYTVEDLSSQSVVTGYNAFPDVCKGVSFWMDSFFSPEAAQLGYLNAPSQKQVDRMFTLAGNWRGEWRSNSDSNETGFLEFIKDGEYLKCTLRQDNANKSFEKIGIKLYGDYFHLIIYDTGSESPTSNNAWALELELFNNTVLLGKILEAEHKALFLRV